MRFIVPLLALLALAAPAASLGNGGQASHLVLSPAQPHAGQTVTFSWDGAGDDVTAQIACDDGTAAYGTLREDGANETLTVTFPAATVCGDRKPSYVFADIYSYSGGSGNYQQKIAYTSFTVLP
jgi:hypothetical protein